MAVTHASLTGAELHEPKGVASATSGHVYVANGSGSGTWKALTFSEMPSGSQLGQAYQQSTTETSITAQIPQDGTVPQSGEGVEILSVAYTPKVSSSIIKIEAIIPFAMFNNEAAAIAALFKDSAASAIAAGSAAGLDFAFPYSNANNVVLRYFETAGSTSSRTYKVRIGPSRGTTLVVCDQTYGGVLTRSLVVTEIKA